MAVPRYLRLTAVGIGLAWPASSLAGTVAQYILPGADSIALYRSPVLAGSEVVTSGADTLSAGSDYHFAADYSFFKLAATHTDTVWVNYQVLDGFSQVVRRFAPVDPSLASGPARPPPAGVTPLAPATGNFQVAGTKKLSFGVGENRSGLVEQSLWLSLSGMVGPDLLIEGTIADRSLPTEQFTRAPSEFDEIFLSARAPGFRSEFGDTRLQRADFSLFSLSRRLSGLSASGEKGALRGGGLLGQRRGQFRTARFYGSEGNQGPYSLATGNRVSVVPGSESVWLDGVHLEEGVERDYTIDYPTGTITFTARRPLLRESRVTVDYEIASSEFQSFITQVGSGVTTGPFHADWLYHSEWDNPDRPTSFALSDSDRALLAAAGDSSQLAVRSGVDSVGAGNGFYNRDAVDSFFVFAGPGLGEFNIVFTYVGPSGGAYRAKGDGSYFFVGDGLGDYSPVVALPLPAESRLLALRTGLAAGSHRLDVEWAGTDNDANRISGASDANNLGSAVLGRYALGADSTSGAELYVKHRDENFRAPGRDAEVEFDRRWGDSLGTATSREDEVGSRLRVGRPGRRAEWFGELRRAGEDDRAWRTGGEVAWSGFGDVLGRAEVMRRDRGTHLSFDQAFASWQGSRMRLPLALKVEGERRVEIQGYRFAEVGTRLGPANLNVQAAWRRTDSLATSWQQHSDLYRTAAGWTTSSAQLDGALTAQYQRREFAAYQTGSEDRLFTESRWLVRRPSWQVRLEHRLSRSQSLSASEEYVPVDDGRGEYREVNGQIIPDPLGNLIRVINPGAYGEVTRQSEKRANVSFAEPKGSLRAEVDLVTIETAANADLPKANWILPWTYESSSPTRRQILRGEVWSGPPSLRWNLKSRWEMRLSGFTTRPQDFEELSGEGLVQNSAGRHLRFEWRGGLGRKREVVYFPYDLTFALGSLSPVLRLNANTEIMAPLFAQRYWSAGSVRMADWLRASVRGTARLGKKSRIVVEPSVNRVMAYQANVPLAVADGRPVGTTYEWRVDGSMDVSRVVVGRVSYRGRSGTDIRTVNRLDVIMEASF